MADQVPFRFDAATNATFEAMWQLEQLEQIPPRRPPPPQPIADPRRAIYISRINASTHRSHNHAAQCILETGSFHPNERKFLQQMTHDPAPSPKQLAWLGKIRYRNRL